MESASVIGDAIKNAGRGPSNDPGIFGRWRHRQHCPYTCALNTTNGVSARKVRSASSLFLSKQTYLKSAVCLTCAFNYVLIPRQSFLNTLRKNSQISVGISFRNEDKVLHQHSRFWISRAFLATRMRIQRQNGSYFLLPQCITIQFALATRSLTPRQLFDYCQTKR